MLLTSARMFQNDVKVLTFCRLAGMVDGHIPPSGWRFFLQMLHCIKALQEDAWQTLVQVSSISKASSHVASWLTLQVCFCV